MNGETVGVVAVFFADIIFNIPNPVLKFEFQKYNKKKVSENSGILLED